MTPCSVRTALLVTCIGLTAAPSFAQRGVSFAQRSERQSGGAGGRTEGDRPEGVRRAPERGTETARREPGSRRGEQDRQARGGTDSGRGEEPRRMAPPPRTETERRVDPSYRDTPPARVDGRQTYRDPRYVEPQYARPYAARPYVVHPYVVQPYVTRPYVVQPYARPYGIRPYARRAYVVPYGYRPYGYRPGWSLNLYFGWPRVYGYTAYNSAPPAYGYYAIPTGLAYGSLRITDAPRDAHVFVDGYYAGVVDDYDGVFQQLNLEVGSHHIEIEAEGYPPIEFDVRIHPGQTITYRAKIY